MTRPDSATALMTDLARSWPDLPHDAQPIASNAIEICKKWDQCNDPKRLLGRQLRELKKRMAAAQAS
jgi:hypothetical protein